MSQEFEYPIPVKRGIFSSLSIPNFRIYIVGHFVSMIGVWMQVVALSWLVWRLTGSADWLGAVGFASRFLTFVLGLVGGVVADKIFRRNLILITQFLSAMQAIILAILTVLAIITPELIIGLVLFVGAIYAFDFPARQSFVTDIVGKDQVDNAVALTASAVHAARVIGPAIAGIIVAYRGEGACFIINAISYIALIVALLLIDKTKLHMQPRSDLPMHKAIHEGLKVAWHSRNLKRPLILLAAMSTFGMPYYILVPIFVDKIYGMGAESYGFLMASSAVGSLFGALIMARSSGPTQLKTNIKVSTIGFALSLIGFSSVTKYWMGMVAMLFIGMFALIALASINAWLQKKSPDHVRGRIMSIYTMMFFGVLPFGSLLAGFSAQRFGAPKTLTAGACIFIAIWIWFILSGKKNSPSPNRHNKGDHIPLA